MKKIYKYPLEIKTSQFIDVPVGAEILSVKNQNGILTLWALVDTDKPTSHCEIEIHGTGNEIYNTPATVREFIETVIMQPFVWHVFKRIN